ncbi:MAG: DNA translocase FtsK [Leptolyngbyaceae cyanobacterium bins.59]|nr:DNA translocase FtsK [Leptolyngbyaceae cyanobacterium bins.59]
MPYWTEAHSIQKIIADLATCSILWVDTEVADWWTAHPRLSLIQVLTDPGDRSGAQTHILDVLDQPDLTQQFIDQIMVNPAIKKVFHNASYDLKFLGQTRAQNITCTLKLARSLSKSLLKTSNCKLKTLAQELCGFTEVDSEPQTSDWGYRPLSHEQLRYASLDPVYLAQVHQKLLSLLKPVPPFTPVSPASSSNALPSLSVTKIRVAFECARLFYLAHHFGGITLFRPPGSILGIGNAFHDLADRLVQVVLQDDRFQALLSPPTEALNAGEIGSQMRDLFYSLVFFPHLQATVKADPSKAAALQHLWQGLTSLIQRWAELLVSNRRYCTAEDVLRKTFLAQELTVQHSFQLPNGQQQLVKGKFDSLIYDFSCHRLYVVEYKTYQSLDPSAQLAQVALYSYMLREKVGVPIHSAVYSVLPDWNELSFTWDELEKTVHQLIPHKLQQMQQWVNWQQDQADPPPPAAQSAFCEICPQQSKCQAFFSVSQSEPTIAPPPEPILPLHPLPAVRSPAPDAEELGQNLVATLQSFGIGVTYQGAAIGPAFVRVKLKPNPGVKVNSILKLSNDLRVQLGIIHAPLIAPQSGYVSVDLPRSDRQTAAFEEYLQPISLSPTDPAHIAIGVNLEGKLIEVDLSDPNTCHFLVGGTTGSGKSEFLRSLLLSLLIRHSPQHLKVALVDPKRVTFPEFEKMPWLYQPIVKDAEGAITLMDSLVAEMESRYQKFEVSHCNNLGTYNQTAPKILPRIVCIFDEYADFMAEKEIKSALELNIKRLGAMSRAAGIHLIIATQRPEATIVTPIIRSNLPGRIALRTASEADSMIILGGKQTEAAYLLGKGDLFLLAGSNLLRLQSLFASNPHQYGIGKPSPT